MSSVFSTSYLKQRLIYQVKGGRDWPDEGNQVAVVRAAAWAWGRGGGGGGRVGARSAPHETHSLHRKRGGRVRARTLRRGHHSAATTLAGQLPVAGFVWDQPGPARDRGGPHSTQVNRGSQVTQVTQRESSASGVGWQVAKSGPAGQERQRCLQPSSTDQ